MAPTDDNSVPGINVAGKNGAAFPVMGNAATGAILVASAGRGAGAISNAPKDANHVSGLIAKDKATGKAFAVQGNKDTGAIFVQDLNGGGGGGGSATWGSIGGDISDNAELTAELNKKANKSGDTFKGEVVVSSDKPVLGFRQIRAGKDLSWGLNSAGDFLLWDNKMSKNIVRVVPDFSYVQIGDVAHSYGTGQPNGRVAAPPGSTYTDTAVTCGAVKWIKTSGTGNTGWTVLYGDTGWRSTPAWFTNGWNAVKLLVRRINNTVHLLVDRTTAAGATGELTINLPAGFRSSSPAIRPLFSTLTQPAQVYRSYVLGNLLVAPNTSKTTPMLSCTISFVTNDDYPNILPGTAA